MYLVPLLFVLAGLALYVVLGGADFGAGFWQLTAGRGEHAEELRELAHESMAPVWEANHVWLIFVLTVTWTAYPTAFGSIMSTLSVALFIAALGIIGRGALYALRTGTASAAEERRIDTVFGLTSMITPFALGAAVGGIASGRVPVGNASGHPFSSWLNPTSVAIGAVAVAAGTYLAAVFLSADAKRLGETSLESAYRTRALGSGVLAGGLAVASLIVVHGDAPRLYHGLVEGDGLPALIISGAAGAATLALVWLRRFEPARYVAALAVAAIVAGWALAQSPQMLPGLTVRQAAAPHDTLVAVTVAVIAGAVILFPALGTLFRMALSGRFDPASGGGQESAGAGSGGATAEASGGAPGSGGAPAEASGGAAAQPSRAAPARARIALRLAVAALIAGIGLVNVANSDLAHGIGAVCLFAFIALAFSLVAPPAVAADPLPTADSEPGRS